VVEPALLKTKKSFAQGKTRPLQFRLAQLQNLKRGLKDMEKDISDAVKADLGRGAFCTWFTELAGLEKQIDFVQANLKSWAKD
jgi:aldehyde dehydrogenase (NAD+)